MTEAEMTFVRRMLPHFLAGKSVLDAAEAVLEDDNRIANVVLADLSPWVVNEFAYARSTRSPAQDRAANVRSALAQEVYARLHA